MSTLVTNWQNSILWCVARRKLHIANPLVILWDLSDVLEALTSFIWTHWGSRNCCLCLWLQPSEWFVQSTALVDSRVHQGVYSPTQFMCQKWWSHHRDVFMWSHGLFILLYFPKRRSGGLTHCPVRGFCWKNTWNQDIWSTVTWATPHNSKSMSW